MVACDIDIPGEILELIGNEIDSVSDIVNLSYACCATWNLYVKSLIYEKISKYRKSHDFRKYYDPISIVVFENVDKWNPDGAKLSDDFCASFQFRNSFVMIRTPVRNHLVITIKFEFVGFMEDYFWRNEPFAIQFDYIWGAFRSAMFIQLRWVEVLLQFSSNRDFAELYIDLNSKKTFITFKMGKDGNGFYIEESAS